jgi:hypothetical protein
MVELMDWNLIGVIIGIISIVVAITLWYISKKENKKVDISQSGIIKQNIKQEVHVHSAQNNFQQKIKSKTKSDKDWVKIYDDSVQVEATRFEEINFDLIKGDKIKGIVREIEGDPFTLYIMKESEFVKFVGKEDFSPLKEYEDIPSESFKFTVPVTDCWYFVFDTYGKQNDRDIIVTIRKRSA